MLSRTRIAVIGAGASTAVMVLVWLLAFHTGIGEHTDQSIFIGFADLQRPHVNGLATFIAKLCDPEPFIALSAGLVAVALLRRRPRVAVGLTVLLVGASVTTQLLKVLLAHPRAHSLIGHSTTVSPESWPSGHATAAMSLALGLVLAVPGRRKPLAAAVGAAFAVAVSYSFLTLGWHFPSDVLGGFLVAVIWTQLMLAWLSSGAARRVRGPEVVLERHRVPMRQALTPVAVALAAAGTILAAIAVVRPHQLLAYASGHTAFIVGAPIIGALALALAAGVMLSVRR